MIEGDEAILVISSKAKVETIANPNSIGCLCKKLQGNDKGAC